MAQALVWVWGGSRCPILQLGPAQGLGGCKASGQPRCHLCFGTQRGMNVAEGSCCIAGGDTALAGRRHPGCPQHSQSLRSSAPTEHSPSPTEVCSVTCAAGGWAQQGDPHPRVSHGRDGAGIKPVVLSAFSTPCSRAQPGTSQGAAPCTSSGTAEWRSRHRWEGAGRRWG